MIASAWRFKLGEPVCSPAQTKCLCGASVSVSRETKGQPVFMHYFYSICFLEIVEHSQYCDSQSAQVLACSA
jgi:hypothetical protein